MVPRSEVKTAVSRSTRSASSNPTMFQNPRLSSTSCRVSVSRPRIRCQTACASPSV